MSNFISENYPEGVEVLNAGLKSKQELMLGLLNGNQYWLGDFIERYKR